MNDRYSLTVMIDDCHRDLLRGVVRSLKPAHVVELGIGAATASFDILDALAENKHGQLTCVDDLTDWKDKKEPVYFASLRLSGARIVISTEKDFCAKAETGVCDLLVSDADHLHSHEWLDQHIRMVRPGGAMFFHDVSNPDYPNLATIQGGLTKAGIVSKVFTKSSTADERCERGWLLAWR